MDALLRQLHQIGVHSIKSNTAVMLEFMETKVQHAEEIDRLIDSLLNTINEGTQKTVTFQCPAHLLQKMDTVQTRMIVEGQRVNYTRSLKETIDNPAASFDIWPVSEKKSISFLSETMGRSEQEAMAFLQSMKEELPSQADYMFTVYYVEDKPAGVVLPHLEPDTDREGRMFWIGMHPDFIGKGLGKNLHLIGLHRLQKEWKAKTYLGSTEINNVPMRNIMVSNGCVERNTVTSLKYANKNT